MSFGSYLASAAESERNRRLTESEGDKNRELQKYNIDQNTLLRNEILSYEHERKKASEQAYDAGVDQIMENIHEEGQWGTQKEKIQKFRKEQQPSFWDIIKGTIDRDPSTEGLGTGGYKKWSEGMNDWIWGGIAPISDEDLYGKPEFERVTPKTFKGMTGPAKLEYLSLISGLDPGMIANMPTEKLNTLMNLVQNNPTSFQAGGTQ